MTVKYIDYTELEKAILIAFSGDKKIIELYDPNVIVENVEDIAKDILRKVKDFKEVECKGVFDKQRMVGFFIRKGGMLISFGLCLEYRVRRFKRDMFALIKEDFKGMFVCFLWSKNVRAIRYLEKNGMKVMQTDYQLTKLVYHK